jgi:hypothetical protein
MRLGFDHEDLRVYQAAILDVHAIRRAKGKPDVIEGKQHLVDLVRMLVAWERGLEDE